MIARIFARIGKSRRHGRPGHSQRGAIMLEAVAALAVTAATGAAALSLISIATLTSSSASRETTASWIASSQSEKIQAASFVITPGQYESIAPPSGFTIVNSTADIPGGDAAIQLVTVSVSSGGEEIVSVEFVKVDR